MTKREIDNICKRLSVIKAVLKLTDSEIDDIKDDLVEYSKRLTKSNKKGR